MIFLSFVKVSFFYRINWQKLDVMRIIRSYCTPARELLTYCTYWCEHCLRPSIVLTKIQFVNNYRTRSYDYFLTLFNLRKIVLYKFINSEERKNLSKINISKCQYWLENYYKIALSFNLDTVLESTLIILLTPFSSHWMFNLG